MVRDNSSNILNSGDNVNLNITKKNQNKKVLILVCISLMLLVVGFILFMYLYGFDKLSWDKKYSNINLEYVTQTNLKLGIVFSNEKKLNEIKYTTNCGKLDVNGLEINWDLNESVGKCKIVVAYRLRKISKEYQVVPFNADLDNLSLNENINFDSDEDLDLDGLTNKQEKEYQTNAILLDTDMDGLDDNYEISTSKTNPNKKDTDKDGLSDYDEVELELDPLKVDSKGDGIKDGERTLTYNYSSDNINLSIIGTGDIASTIVQVTSNTKISSKTGLIDKLYTLYTEGTMTEAVVTITYTDDDLVKYGLNEDNLSIYYYNEKELKYEKVLTTVDKEKNALTATLKHFSSYVVGDSSLVRLTTTNQVLFILDNSWSMYSNEQYKEITGKDYGKELDGFDKNGIRFMVTSNLVSNLSKKSYQIGLSEFRRDYKNILKIGSDTGDLVNSLSVMNGNFKTKKEGTNIGNALTNGIKEFSSFVDNKYIVILTDGQDTALNGNADNIIDKAIKSDVKICAIGFGDSSYNIGLSNISNATGCKFFSSSNVDGLYELFDNLRTELNDDFVDITGDGVIDGVLLADSGFVVNRDGFSFVNYGSNLSTRGHCYGMASFAQLYYKKQLPLVFGKKTVDGDTSYAYNLTNTYFGNQYNMLYDYTLQTNALKYMFGFPMFGEVNPVDFKVVKENKLVFNDKYRSEIDNSLLFDIENDSTSLSESEQIKKYGAKYDSYEKVIMNEDKMQNSTVINNDDLQMFNAIYAGFISQNARSFYSSGTSLELWIRDVTGNEPIDYTGEAGFINVLKSRLNDKDALVIVSDFSGAGLHAINAISLVQGIKKPNHYYIGVYDNNYPGEKRYVEIKCKMDSCVTVANDYYNNSGYPIRITPSLEYDLKYYHN